MRINIFVFALITAALTTNTFAAPPPQAQAQRDVNVVNTPNVTVTNPQTTVTVDNTSGNPVPVTGTVTVDDTSPIAVNVTNNNGGMAEHAFVGLSSAIITPSSAGIGAMHGACEQTYPGTGARMCTTVEVTRTPNLNQVVLSMVNETAKAWVQPVGVTESSFTTAAGVTRIERDSTGMRSELTSVDGSLAPSLSCDGWSNPSPNIHGAVYFTFRTPGVGAIPFQFQACDNTYHVMCCSHM